MCALFFLQNPNRIQQYKAHVLSLLEQSAGAIYHAADSHLDVLDSLQRRFLREIGLSENNAFLKHNLAPLRLRRDIAVLGLLHRIQLGEAHDDFSRLFEKATHPTTTTTRHSKRRHGKQFRETWGNTDYYNRSIFSSVRAYNILPEYVVNTTDVQSFQSLLTKDARFACRIGRKLGEDVQCAFQLLSLVVV